jgi:hypothetical protein
MKMLLSLTLHLRLRPFAQRPLPRKAASGE